ncbi:MAG: acetyl-CoA carboxylase biotin carboxyl carrier protein [Flavobacteriaceae bacterium]|nr:acetyl-CoA carboxylase biotin carboxyl carrier protein [Flavobacteriaceae bacterium]MCY4253544.1 acetyl-CoA carboxylase biotin carboxyl carrier protein [Flavobacteriaceae bacterium]
MDLKDIQNLIKFISKTDVEQVKLEFENVKITVSKSTGIKQETTPQIITSPTTPLPIEPPIQSTLPPTRVPEVQEESSQSNQNLKTIKSPMLGTLYLHPSPDDPPFVSIGDPIRKGDTLCTIEAMKLFNHINSEYSGKIVDILVDNSSPVEFDQPLFVIELS